MARLFFVFAVYILVTADLLGIARDSRSLASPNSTMAESGKEKTNDMKKRGFQAKEVTNSSSAFSPGGDDPIHDKSNTSAKEVTNSSSAFSPGGDDPIHDKFNMSAKEVTNSSSAFSPGGDDPIHDKSNMSDTNSVDSTSYNADGAVNPSCADLYYDYINRSDTQGANSGNSCPQLGVVLYISLILCIAYLFG